MANDQHSHLGLRPLRRLDAKDVMYFRANTAQNIFRFQPVAINNSGQVEVAGIGDNTQIVGAAIGFLDTDNAALPTSMDSLNEGPFLSSSNDGLVAVAANPELLFILEADTGGSATIGQSNIGNSCGFTYSATTGNTTTGIANVLLDASDAAADSGGTFKIVGLAGNVNQDGTFNTGGSNFAKAVVKINHHQLGQGSFSAAV